MPWKQVRYLLDSEVQSSDDATKIVKLPLSNVLHTLYVTVECTTGSTNAQDLDIDSVVDKIEVIGNGSEVIFSLTPAEIRRWAFLDLGGPLVETVNEGPSQVMKATYPIFFGFEEWDPNYWLPCDRFTDLELRIKYSPTISATAWATGTVTITVIALMTMGGAPGDYRGTVRRTTVYDFTTAASGDEVIDLPRRLLYFRCLIYCYEAGIEDGTNITKVKLSLNNDERIPLNLDWNDLKDWNQVMYKFRVYRDMLVHRADDDVVHTKIAHIQGVKVTSFVSANIGGDVFYVDHADAIAGDGVTLECLTVDVTAGSEDLIANTTDHYIYLEVTGKGLPHAVVIPFKHLAEGEFFDPTRFDMVQLILTQGGAGGDAKVSLEEILRVG